VQIMSQKLSEVQDRLDQRLISCAYETRRAGSATFANDPAFDDPWSARRAAPRGGHRPGYRRADPMAA
jgi:hypothetical protein